MHETDLQFTYRLPLTFVRVVGSVEEARDTLTGETAVQREAVVTTEHGADLLTEINVVIDNDSKATQKTTWNLLPDGRLTGADFATTVDRYLNWSTWLKVGGFALAAAMPLLVPGPAGWLGAVGALGATTGRRSLRAGQAGESVDDGLARQQQSPGEKRMAAYAEAKPRDAELLRRYRHAFTQAEDMLVEMSESLSADNVDRLRSADQAMRIVRTAMIRAEEKYVAWLDSAIIRNSCEIDERLRVDDLPSKEELKNWAHSAASSHLSRWEQLARDLQTAVSVDILDPMDKEASVADRGHRFKPEPALHDAVMWRRPRSAEASVWKVTPAKSDGYSLKLLQTQRLHITYPGNEKRIPLESTDDTSRSVAVTFEADGSLTKIVTDATGTDWQRNADLTAMLTGVENAAAAGKELRGALVPPSVEEQAAAAEASAKLMPAADDDEVAALKKRLAEQQLRARLRIAEQLAVADSPPVIVRFDSE